MPDTSWTSDRTALVKVRCWGAGGIGRLGDATDAGGGGGGGAYAERSNIPVTLGTVYFIRFGRDGEPRESIFGTGIDPDGVTAEGGFDASFASGGQGGRATHSVGDIVHSGGTGGPSQPSTFIDGGGGGGSGTPDADGPFGTTPAGGDPGPQGGKGGDGGPTAPFNPQPGFQPGGGGGGAGAQLSGQINGAAGADGAVQILTNDGLTVIAQFGNPPPPPTPPKKRRTSAFIM